MDLGVYHRRNNHLLPRRHKLRFRQLPTSESPGHHTDAMGYGCSSRLCSDDVHFGLLYKHDDTGSPSLLEIKENESDLRRNSPQDLDPFLVIAMTIFEDAVHQIRGYERSKQ